MPFSSGKSPLRPKYSLKWAESVVKSTFQKHPRGANFFSHYTGLSWKKLAFILARNNGEWHTIRLCIASLERAYEITVDMGKSIRLLKNNLWGMMQVFVKNARKSNIQTFAQWAEGLTPPDFSAILEEPDEKGEGVRSDSDDPLLPSLFGPEGS